MNALQTQIIAMLMLLVPTLKDLTHVLASVVISAMDSIVQVCVIFAFDLLILDSYSIFHKSFISNAGIFNQAYKLIVIFMTDTNECASDPCDGNATCTNHAGTYACECNLGYTGNGHNCSGKSKRKRILRKPYLCLFILISGEFSTQHFNI